MGKKSDPPPPPDYTAAAEAQAKSSREVTEQQSWANRPDQNTPWGSSTWSNRQVYDPSTQQYLNRWTQNQSLNPELQGALDSQINLQRGRSDLAASKMGQIADEFGQPISFGQGTQLADIPQATKYGGGDKYIQDAEDAIYNRSASRLDTRFQREGGDIEARLYSQGLRPGDQAWDRAMDEQGEVKNDAYQQAQYQATIGAGAEGARMQDMDVNAGKASYDETSSSAAFQNTRRQQEIAEEMQRRGYSLNEANAILTGQQVQTPNMPQFSLASKSDPTQYLSAANMQHDANMANFSAGQAQDQASMAGVTSLASTAMMFSDRRLKRDIVRIGKTLLGTPLYVFRYLWDDTPIVGVMADEAPAEAVQVHPSGYLVVDVRKV